MLVHGRPSIYRDEGVRCWPPISESPVPPFCVFVLSPSFDEDPGLLQREENLAIRQFIPEARVEAFAVAVLQGRARVHAGGLRSDRLDPIAQLPRNEPGAIVRPDEPRPAALEKRSVRASGTSVAFSGLWTRIINASRPYPWRMSCARQARPSLVRSCRKSQARTWLGCSGFRRTQEPSLRSSRPCFFRLCGTLSPSRRQMPVTRLWFVCHGMGTDQLKEPKRLQKENEWLGRRCPASRWTSRS